MAQTRNRPPTIGDVAKAANVARSTVSRAFAHPGRLKKETVAHVMAIAEELGFSPSPVARALSTGKSRIIGLVVPDIANPFFPPLIQTAQRMAEDLGYDVFLGDTNEDAGRELKLVRRFSQQVAGLILVSTRLGAEQGKMFARSLPVVFVNQDFEGTMRILIDSASGIAEAVDHIAALGHGRVVYIGGPAKSWAQKRRMTAVRQATAAVGMDLQTMPAQKPTHEGGRSLAQAVADLDVTAAIVFDDLLAQGLVAGLAEIGRRVPQDLNVIGCDDVIGATTTPPLTTISAPTQEAAEAAISLLTAVLNGSPATDVRHVLGTHVVVRKSTGPAPKG